MMAAEDTSFQTDRNDKAPDALPIKATSPEAEQVVPVLVDVDLDAAHENWTRVEKTMDMLLKAAAIVRGMRAKNVPEAA